MKQLDVESRRDDQVERERRTLRFVKPGKYIARAQVNTFLALFCFCSQRKHHAMCLVDIAPEANFSRNALLPSTQTLPSPSFDSDSLTSVVLIV